MQMSLDFTHKARRSDPLTSHVAAKRARQDLYQPIVAALSRLGEGTFYEIAAYSGLDPIDVARRMKNLERKGLAVRTNRTRPGPKGNECTVWSV